MKRRQRSPKPSVDLPRGERLLAWARGEDGNTFAGSEDALYVAAPGGSVRRVPWEQVEAASWDAEAGQLRISEVGTWGEERVEYETALDDPGRLLALLRERVTASIVLQRHVELGSRTGIARRAPRGAAEITWLFEYDEGVDPTDPQVSAAATSALALARRDVGLD